jgi:DNA-binding NtrC family response regulator
MCVLSVRRGESCFRDDLFYRIAQSIVQVPSLAERREDIPLLIEHFLRNLPSGAPAARSFSEEALALVTDRPFPGNVRELRNIVERAALLAEQSIVSAADLEIERAITGLRTRDPTYLHQQEEAQSAQPRISSLELFKEAKQTAIAAFERAYLDRLLRRAGSNLTRAASFAGLERHNLRALLRKHSLYGSD